MATIKLITTILAQYQLNPDHEHGMAHWARVLENGLRLAEVTGADATVINLFALFHDACPEDEWKHPEHGARGERWLRSSGGRPSPVPMCRWTC